MCLRVEWEQLIWAGLAGSPPVSHGSPPPPGTSGLPGLSHLTVMAER